MDGLVEKYFRSGLAPSTQRTYDSAKKRFLTFCSQSLLTPLPISEQISCRYVSHLADQGLSPKSIKSYLSAVRHLQISMHMPDPKFSEMKWLEQVMQGIKREYAKRSPGKRTRLPVTPDILLKMRKVLERESKDHDAIMIWAACCLVLLWVLEGWGRSLFHQRQRMTRESISISQTFRWTAYLTPRH